MQISTGANLYPIYGYIRYNYKLSTFSHNVFYVHVTVLDCVYFKIYYVKFLYLIYFSTAVNTGT